MRRQPRDPLLRLGVPAELVRVLDVDGLKVPPAGPENVLVTGAHPGAAESGAAVIFRSWFYAARDRKQPTGSWRWRDLGRIGIAARAHPEGEGRMLEALVKAPVLALTGFRPWGDLVLDRAIFILDRRWRSERASILAMDADEYEGLATLAPSLRRLLDCYRAVRCRGAPVAVERK